MTRGEVNSASPIPEGAMVSGNVIIGSGVLLSPPVDINGNYCLVRIGDGCDIAAFVTITCADSHLRCIGLDEDIERLPISIGEKVFIGQGAIILGGCVIGERSVIGAGVVLRKNTIIPPESFVRSAPPEVFIKRRGTA